MLYQIFAIVIIDSDGNRIACKYALPGGDNFPEHFSDFEGQTKFESEIAHKVSKNSTSKEPDIISSGDCTILIRSSNDIHILVVGPLTENEVILAEVLAAVYGTLCNITNNHISKKSLIEKLDAVYLSLDEVMDGGLLFALDPSIICARAQMVEGTSAIDEATDIAYFNQALTSAKDNILRSFLSAM